MKNIEIRLMKPEEKKELKRVMRGAFPFIARLFFYFTKNILVAISDDKIVGGAILKLFYTNKDVKAGNVCFIFSSKELKGLGIGKLLTDASIKYFEELGCKSIFATV